MLSQIKKTKMFLSLIAMLIFVISCNKGGGSDSPVYNPVSTPQIALSINNLLFDGVLVGQEKVVGFSIKNTGSIPVKFSSVMSIDGENAKEFEITNSCDFNIPLQPGIECQIDVKFHPLSVGKKIAFLNINDVTDAEIKQTDSNVALYKLLSSDEELTDGKILLSGEGLPVPYAEITHDLPSLSFNFGNTEIGLERKKTIKLSNIGTTNLSISSLSLIGDEAFKLIQYGCDVDIVPNGYCSLDIIVLPRNGGYKTARLQIISNDSNNPTLEFELSARAYSANYSLSTSSIEFGEVVKDQTVEASVELTNTGSSVLKIKNITLSGSGFVFGNNNTCKNKELAYKEKCSIDINFKPLEGMIYRGQLVIMADLDEKGQEVITIPTSGEGIIPILVVSESYVDFDKVNKNNSIEKQIILKNSGKDNLVIHAIEVADNVQFSVNSSACVKTFVKNETCSINVRFEPTSYGEHISDITIKSNDLNGNKHVTLRGIGSGSEVDIVSKVDFGKVKTETVKSVSIKNTGYDDIIINSIELEKNEYFVIQSNPCTTIKKGGACNIDVKFLPPHISNVSDNLSVTFNNTEKHNIGLTGEGIAPKIVIDDSELDFGDVFLTAFQTKTLRINNTGTDELILSSFAVTGDFTISSNTCTSSVLPDKNCLVVISLSPSDMGTRTGKLSFTSNDINANNFEVNLHGVGILAKVTVNPMSLVFGEVLIGAESAEQSIKLKNEGNANIEISEVSLNGPDFISRKECSVLPVGADCFIAVKFTPKSNGEKNDTLRIISNDSRNPIRSVALSGVGTLSHGSQKIAYLQYSGAEKNTFIVPKGVSSVAITAKTAITKECKYYTTVVTETICTLFGATLPSVTVYGVIPVKPGDIINITFSYAWNRDANHDLLEAHTLIATSGKETQISNNIVNKNELNFVSSNKTIEDATVFIEW